MSATLLQPHGLQPSRLLCKLDFPGKNTGVGFCVLWLVTKSFLTLCDLMNSSLSGRSVQGGSPDKNTGVGHHVLLHGIFPTQGSNSGLHYCRQIIYHLNQQRRPRILEWVAYPFSRGSSQSRNWTRVSYIAGGFFASWATREALFPFPGDLPDPGIKPVSFALAGEFFTTQPSGNPHNKGFLLLNNKYFVLIYI